MESPDAVPPPLPRLSARWRRVVRVASYLTIVFPGVIVLAAVAGLFPFGLIPAAGFVWAVHSLDQKLREPEAKQGLALAFWVGLATTLYFFAFFAMATEGFRFWDQTGVLVLGGLGLVPALLAGFALLAFRTSVREPGDARLFLRALLPGSIYFVAIFIPAAIALPGLMRSRIAANQASAVGSLRTINVAMKTYASTYHNGFAPSLKSLGPAAPGQPSSNCNAADLIGEVLASGQKSGYVFEFQPGPQVAVPAPGCPPGMTAYAVTARPTKYLQTGEASYFTDQLGVIHSTHEDRPPTTSDPPYGN